MSERKLRRMSRTELIDVIDTLRQDETPQDTEALRRVDAERERLTERRRFWRGLRGTVSTLIVVAAIAVLLATLLLIHLQILRPLSLLSQALRTIRSGHSISELPRVRIRELQDVLDVLPDISRHVDVLNTRSGQLAQERDQYADLSFRDALTGVYNRRALEETMERIPARTPLALLMLDLDFFKNYNDRFGHQAGDAALKAVAQATQKALLRDSDRIFRYGGEEFTIILAGAGQYSAMTVAQRILEEVAALDLVHPDSRTGKLTVSIGIAHRSFGEDADICEVLTHADQALYEAKTSGRNRIVLFEG